MIAATVARGHARDGVVVASTMIATTVVGADARDGVIAVLTTVVVAIGVMVSASASVGGVCIVISCCDGACFRSGCDRGAVTSAWHF